MSYYEFMDRFFLKTLLILLVTPAAWGKISVEETTPVPMHTLEVKANDAELNRLVIELDSFSKKDLSEVLNSPAIRNSSVAKAAEKTKLSGQVGLNDHNLQFDVQALQGSAKVKYSGWQNLELRYQSQQSYLDFGWKF